MPSEREPLLRRTTLALVALATLGLGACGDDGDEPDAEREAESAGVLTADEIDEALLPIGSTVGGAEVGLEGMPGLADERKADREECQPLSALVDVEPEPVREDRVQPEIKWGAWVDVQLLTYREGDAERVLDQVAAAIEACAGGYVDTRLRAFPVHEVVGEDAPDLGDEALAFTVTATDSMDTEWYPFDEHSVMVRDGQQLLTFRTGSVGDDAEARALLDAVVEAQWKRYDAAR